MEATRVAYLWRRVAGGLCVLLGGAVMAFAQLNRSIVPTADKLKYQNQINAEVPISQYFSGNALALMEQTWGSTQLPLSSMLVPYPLFGNIFSQTVLDAPSSYNAMHVKVQKRFSHGLNFIAVYTWS